MDRLPSAARGQRFDHALQIFLREQGRDASVREVRQALQDGLITIDGRRRKPGDRAQGAELVNLERLVLRSEVRPLPQPELLNRVSLVHQDDQLVVLSKPSGMPTVPITVQEQDTLLNAAVAVDSRIAESGPPLDAGAVHRLDTATSGLVMFAVTPKRRLELRRAFSEHQIEKEYWACVEDSAGSLTDDTLRHDIVARGPQKTSAEAPGAEPGQLAISRLRVWQRREGRTWVRVLTHYGRRHQVRVQLASLGTPIVGDAVYGEPDARLALHATRLSLPDGACFDAPVPDDLRTMLNGWAP